LTAQKKLFTISEISKNSRNFAENLDMADWFNILRDIGIFGLALWFIQYLLNKSASRKFEVYKTELEQKTREFQATLDSKLELYKAELNIQSYKATKIYEQQLAVIIELDRKLKAMNEKALGMRLALMSNKNKDKAFADATIAHDNFRSFYRNNAILIPQETTDKLDDILKEHSTDFANCLSKYQVGNSLDFQKEAESIIVFVNEMQEAEILLKSDFKKLLGVER